MVHSFSSGIETGAIYQIQIERHPGRQQCEVEQESGVIQNSNENLQINCIDDISASVFELNKLHKIRLTIDADEWQRFVLDTERARYTNGDANGSVSEWNSWTHSEVYRQVDFEYLNQDGDVLGGTINFILKKSKPGFHGDIITQGIYNGLEGKAGDYKYVGSIGNRFLDNKLGLLGQLDIENRTRSSHDLGARYTNAPANLDSVNAVSYTHLTLPTKRIV